MKTNEKTISNLKKAYDLNGEYELTESVNSILSSLRAAIIVELAKENGKEKPDNERIDFLSSYIDEVRTEHNKLENFKSQEKLMLLIKKYGPVVRRGIC